MTCCSGSRVRREVSVPPREVQDAAWTAETASTAETSEQALALARAWADGRQSWINAIHADTQERRLEVVAVLDAQEVVKWSALAVAYARIELDHDIAEYQRVD